MRGPRLTVWSMVALGAGLLVVAAPRDSEAVPAFARQYRMQCSVCHSVWPALNDFGRAFKERGYMTTRGEPEGREQALSADYGGTLLISRNGSRYVYYSPVATPPFILRDRARLAGQPIAGTDRAATAALSPDGETIVLATGSPGDLQRMAVTGGSPVTLVRYRPPPVGSSTSARKAFGIFSRPLSSMRAE